MNGSTAKYNSYSKDKIPKGILVSIVIPVYNTEKYIRQCLNSIINQTYENLEIIIVDDGSTDKSGKLCDEYATYDSRITVFHTENHGLSAARNFALDRMSGEYVAFIDSDDWIEKNTISRLMSFASIHRGEIIACQCTIEWKEKSIQPNTDNIIKAFEREDILNDYIINGTMGTTIWNKLYSVDFFSSIRFPEGHNYEDEFTTYLFAEMALKVVCIPDKLYHYRQRQGSIIHTYSMNNLIDHWLSCYKKYDELINISQNYRQPIIKKCIWSIGRMWRNYYVCSKEERKYGQTTILEMNAFSQRHVFEVLKGKYPLKTKALCLITIRRSTIIMWLFYCINRFYILTRGKLYSN